MTDRDLMKQALDALMTVTNYDAIHAARIALRERLAHCDRCGKKLGGDGDIHTCTPPAQPVQEPVAFEDWHSANYLQPLEKYGDSYKNMHVRNRWQGWIGAKSTPPAAPVQEPVATVQCINGITIGYLEVMQPVGTKLYTTPPAAPQPKQEPVGFAGIEMWIGNTRIKKLMTQAELHSAIDPWAIVKLNSDHCIDALKEKNNG